MAQRCMRSFLEPIKRVKTLPCSRSYVQTFARNASTDDKPSESKQRKDEERLEQLKMDLADDSLPLEQRMEKAGINVNRYKRELRANQLAQKRFADWEPKTREEAKQRWKELQDTPDHLNVLDYYKNQGVEPIKLAKERGIKLETDEPPLDPKTQEALDALRTPINVRAMHMRPLRRSPEYGVPVCDLQLRTYSIRNLLLFADFAVRAAYYMGLPARGPIPLPRITERWTVPRSNFIFKKSQENFERITMRRLVQIQDGHPDVVKAWLAFLQKHQYWGVGMKANIYEYEDLESATRAGYALEKGDYSRRREGAVMQKVEEILNSPGYKEAMKGHKEVENLDFRP